MKTKRLLSLDVFRGITMVLMILVNAEGITKAPFKILDHAPWNGGTIADLVFPFFLYIVGLTGVIVLSKQMKEMKKSTIFLNICERSLIILIFGLLVNMFPYHMSFENMRYYGILQRIALCYFICSTLYINTSVKIQMMIFVAILLLYWYIMTLVPVPGFGVGQLTETGNWVSYLDRSLFPPNHLLGKVSDPEGLFSTFPALATTLLGMFTGSLLLTPLSQVKKFYIILVFGIGFLCLSLLWNINFPINKNLWTSSYVLWSGGYALIVFGLCYLIIDIFTFTSWTLPFKIMGMNALFIFILHEILLKIQVWFYTIAPNGTKVTLENEITQHLFGYFSPQIAGLLYSITFLLFNFLVAFILYQRKIFIRI